MRKKYDKRYKKVDILLLDDVLHNTESDNDICIGNGFYINKQYLDHNDDYPCVPFTAMSLVDYQQLELPFVPDYALIANGSILLHNDHMIAAWSQLVKNMLQNYMPDMELTIKCIADIDLIYPPEKVKFINGSFVFVQTPYVNETYDALKEHIDFDRMTICVKDNTLYVIPKKLDKTILIKNFAKYVKASKIIMKGGNM